MYLESVYTLHWKILNIIAGRGAGKTYTACSLLKFATNLGLKTALLTKDDYTNSFLMAEYFKGVAVKPHLYNETDMSSDLVRYHYDLLVVEEATALSAKAIDALLEFAKRFKGKIILTFSPDTSDTVRKLTTWRDDNSSRVYDVHNLYIYPPTHTGDLLANKIVGNIYKHKYGILESVKNLD